MAFRHDESLTFPTLKQHNLPIGRVYMVESGEHKGEVYPSITRVLAAKPKPALEAWKKRVGKAEAARVSQRATVQGGNVHRVVECYLNNRALPAYGPNVAELWKQLKPWLDQNITKVYAQEQDLCSHKLKVAGRTDILAEVLGRRAVVDVKTSLREKREEWVEDYLLQATFYSLAAYEATQVPFKRIVIPIVHPTGLQVFEASPMDYASTLVKRINEFYESYEKGLDF